MQKVSTNIYWLSGNYFQRRTALKKILENLGEHELSVIDDEVSYEWFKQEVNTFSCFDARKVIVLNRWPTPKGSRASMIEDFKKLINKIPENCIVIANNLETQSKDLVKKIDKVGQVLSLPQYIEERKAAVWLHQKIKERGKHIDEQTAVILCKSLPSEYKKGINIDHIILLIKKIFSYVGKERKITREDAMMIGIDSDDFVIWSLFSYLDKKEYEEALKLLYRVWRTEKKPEQQVVKILTTMVWRYRLLLMVKDGLSKKWNNDKIIEEVKKIHKLSREGGSGLYTRLNEDKKEGQDSGFPLYSDAVVGMTMRQFYNNPAPVTCYTRKDLLTILMIIGDLFNVIRYKQSSRVAIYYFELLILAICGKMSYDCFNFIRATDYD